MSDPSTSDAALQRALHALRDLRERAERAENAATEPIAIVGMGCRLPSGANSPESFWDLLRSGRDGVGAIPPGRWDHDAFHDSDPHAPGTISTDQGGFIDQPVDMFDAPFFGIAPIEANDIDPQQRLLLEVTWEALEHAGIAADRLVGSSTGVFVGISTSDYAHLVMRDTEPADLGTYAGTGVSPAVAAGRLSYTLGLRGPAMSLDTACSSSLVSIAMATQSLRAGTCRTALAGGVNLMLDPQTMVSLSNLSVLSPTGRCHTFAADADGYARGEGAGMIVMKRLSDAQADGDRILAVVRSASFNHDGRSSGLTVPSAAAQRELIESALADAGLQPPDVDVVEAHGTGTNLGDPIEVRAIDAVYSRGRAADQPLLLGSVKTNVGHLEAAAGIAGVIKTVLALQHEELPPHLHCDELSPHIDWSRMPITVNRQLTPWARSERPRRAAVSGFGWSGTNAHVILEEAPSVVRASESADRPVVLALSAHDETALTELASRTADALEAGLDLHDLAWTLQDGRARFPRRLAVTARSNDEAVRHLRSSGTSSGDITGTATSTASVRPRVAFVFTGQGSQLPRMGRELFEREPVFRAVLEECDAAVSPHLPHGLLDVMYGDEKIASLIHRTEYTQPAMFGLQCALAAQWRSWGITPDVVVGHSIGEYAAAVTAGVMDLSSAAQLIATRGRLMGALPVGGKMVAVFAEQHIVDRLIAPHRLVVSVAAVNGPTNVVVSGDGAAIDELLAELDRTAVRYRRLEVSHAFHSPLMTPIVGDFEVATRGIEFRTPTVPFVSTLSGTTEKDAVSTPQYWRDQATGAVQFAAAIDSIVESGIDHFVELGPQPTLLGMIARIRASNERLHASLRPGPGDRGDQEQLFDALGGLWADGIEPNWRAVDGDMSDKVEAPTYPFQRQRYWYTPTSGNRHRSTGGHPLLGQVTNVPALGATIHEAMIRTESPAWIGDHRVAGVAVLPDTAFTEMVLATCDAGEHIESLSIHHALALPADGDVTVQTIVTESDGRRSVRIVSLNDDVGASDGHTVHATATVERSGGLASAPTVLDIEATLSDFDEDLDAVDLTARLSKRGPEYGPAFGGLTRLLLRDGAALGKLALPPESPDAQRYRLHPALFDACLRVLSAAVPTTDDDMFVPVRFDGVRVYRPSASTVWCSARLIEGASPDAPSIVAQIDIFDEDGTPVASVERYVARRTSASSWVKSIAPSATLEQLYELVWRPSDRAERDDRDAIGSWVIIGDDASQADALAASMSNVATIDVATLAPFDADRFDRMVGATANAQPGRPIGVVVLCRDDGTVADTVTIALDVAQHLAAQSAADTRLWFVTRGGQAIEGEAPSLGAAAVWGLGRTVANEHPQLACVCIDLDPARRAVDLTEVDSLAAELLAARGTSRPADDQIATRGERWLAARLVRHDLGSRTPPTAPYGLVLTKRGTFDNLSFASIERRPLSPGEVEIEVRATGLDARDVSNVLGMYSGDPGLPGLECAGIITAVGDDVRDHRVGDAVFGIAPRAFDSHVVTRADLVVGKPAAISFAEAATLPIAHVTAIHGLHTLAGLTEGQSVLIHAAPDGVGLAAVSRARNVGAEVFATAGNAAHSDVLATLGVSNIFDVRAPDLAAQILAVTAGRGVDVVLNSLSDEFSDRSSDVLARDGTLLEIGKRDVRSVDQAPAVPPDATSHVYDLADLLADDAAAVGSSLQTIADELRSGAVKPLPLTAFPADRIRAAFGATAHAHTPGKIVITHRSPAPRIRDDGTYIVTGGLGGLGLVVAQWLADQGAQNLTLASRSAPSAEATAAISAMREHGTRVEVVAADVSDAADVDRLVGAATAEGLTLRGVFHAAGVLDDGALAQQSWSRFATVFAPKLGGAENLDRATRHLDLDHMVFFSSVAAVLGSPGQSNYAAANSAVDALAHRRRAAGRVALSVNWGAWAEAGMAARLDEREHRRMADRGIGLLTTESALEALGRLLDQGTTHATVMSADWSRLFASIGGEPPALLSELAEDSIASAPVGVPTAGALVGALVEVAPDGRRGVASAHVVEQVIRVLGLGPGSTIDPEQNLAELGMDSLMAVELTNRLRLSSGLALEPTLTFDHPHVHAIAVHLTAQLDRVVTLKAKLAAMSPEEVSAALAARRATTETPTR